jgi:hypothetical protein
VVAALLTVTAIQALGPATFWLAAAAGHLGSALLAYAGIGLLWLIGPADVDSVAEAPDFGISCVVAGVLGALAVGASGRLPVAWRLVAVAAGIVIWGVIAAAATRRSLHRRVMDLP